ncbi:MAG: AmmeMemoRadiSam system protein B [Desulfomonile sp.]|nr:AmmeMemoRadiSam system protein B [Deltaproteobacteria bacterium]
MESRRRTLPDGWYPASSSQCTSQIKEFLTGFSPPLGAWTGGIVPHAGWYYSGRAAARVLKTISHNIQPDRVVVYGGHLRGGSNPLIYIENEWETPLGIISMDKKTSQEILSEGLAVAVPPSFSDNTVEVVLPMIKYFFPDAVIIAVHSPASDMAIKLGTSVQELLQAKALSAAYVGSADLTHYGQNYGFTPQGKGSVAVQWVKEENDKILIDHALVMDAPGLLRDSHVRNNTCSAGPIASVIASELKRGVRSGFLVDYYTSYDVTPSSSFVGYAGIVY